MTVTELIAALQPLAEETPDAPVEVFVYSIDEYGTPDLVERRDDGSVRIS